jgi:hypothetical protein
MPNRRKKVPRDHPLFGTFDDTDVKRVNEDLDDIFDFGSNELERDNVKVHRGRKGAATVEPDGYLDDEEFETFTEKAKSSDKLGWDPMAKENFAKSNKLSTPKPIDVHLSRDRDAAQADINRKAKVTTDPAKYANDPTRYDYPFLDTPKEFREEYGDKSFDELESKAGPDDIFEW